jgi:hypothetical protein
MPHEIHEGTTHEHGPGCGHPAVMHEGHVDYLEGGHLHHPHAGHMDEHRFAVDAAHPEACTPGYHGMHGSEHRHGPGCGHQAVPHGDHTDYLVDGSLHHQHGDHCDNHGPVDMA